MPKFWLILFLLLTSFAFALDVQIGDRLFHLEVANTPEAAVRGLMEREFLPPDCGMLFVFPQEGVHSFWMKNTKIPLDVAFVNSFGVVRAVHTMKVESPRMADESLADYERRLPMYSSRFPVAFAIEVNAGVLKEVGIRPGSMIAIFPQVDIHQ